MYNVFAWRYTGFNTVNLPDSPSRLKIENAHQFPAIDYLQNVFINKVTIRATFEEAIGIDYIAVIEDTKTSSYPSGATFYIVNEVTMTSGDVAVLSVSEDFITTAGGLEDIVFVGGMITRRSIADSENVMFEFQRADNYLQYNEQPLLIADTLSIQDITQSNTPERHFIESTIDLDTYLGSYTTTVDQSTGTTVQTPDAQEADPTQFYIDGITDGGVPASDKEMPNPTLSGLYYDASRVTQSVAKLRARGIENAIVASYAVPEGAVNVTQASVNHIDKIKGASGVKLLTGDYNFDLDSVYNPSGSAMIYKRIYSSELFNYGIMTSAGNKLEASPILLRNGNAAPRIAVLCDPRSTGRPYFAFDKYAWHSLYGTNPTKEFFMFCVSGAQWRQVPLVFRGASGSEIIQEKYNLSSISRETGFGMANTSARMATRNAMFDYNLANDSELQRIGFVTTLGNTGSFLDPNVSFSGTSLLNNGSKITNVESAGIGVNVGAGRTISGLYALLANAEFQGRNASYNAMRSQLNLESAQSYEYGLRDMQEAQRNEELYALGVQLGDVAPAIAFGGDINTFRDIIDDGVIVYRYRPTTDDVKRLNKILHQFGHAVAEPISLGIGMVDYKRPDDDFDYIQIAGAQIASTKSNEGGSAKDAGSYAERIGVGAQLSGGIRFWHKDVNPWY